MAASHREQRQRKKRRGGNMGWGAGRRRMNRRGCFQFSEDTPNIIKEKCRLGHAQSNFNDSPPHTPSHLLCTLHRQCEYFHFKPTRAYSLKGRGEERYAALPSAFSTQLPGTWITIQVRRNGLPSSLTLTAAPKLDKRNCLSKVISPSRILTGCQSKASNKHPITFNWIKNT